jgi:hypothetical protein
LAQPYLIFAIRRAQFSVDLVAREMGMPGQQSSNLLWKTSVVACAAISACAALLITAALAHEPQQADRAATAADGDPPAASSPETGVRPGLIEGLGRWLEEGASRLRSGIGGARDRLDQLGGEARDAVQDAAGAVPSLPTAFSARARCLAAPNGAPDCQSAVETLCRGKCPARLLLSRRSPNAKDCSTEIFVTRAVCL